ncbi:MAG: ATP-binding cassette domain-containing protein, partial [Eubacterium sp.]|nr:ATP-binding cassette domain-containing protein [Eubacterium sp.]
MEILSVNSISKSFDNKKVLEDVSLSLEKGELISLLGVSGTGKTTLFNCISGILNADSGSILLNGNDITGKPGQVSYMLQKDMLLEYKKIIDNVALPLLIKKEKNKAAREKARKHFKEFGLEGYEKKYPSQMSGGMRQRTALLRTYLFSGEVALLD